MSYLPLNYKTGILYLRNKDIREYDIQSGGYNVTIAEKLIDDENLIKQLRIANKHERQVLLGLYARDTPGYSKALNEAFRKYVTAFVELNDVRRERVLFIKKDSVTLFDSPISRFKFKNVLFTERGRFTSYLKIKNLEFYIGKHVRDDLIKGITLPDYSDTLIEEIFKIMRLAEFNDSKFISKYLTELRQNYVNKVLANSYYRELSVNAGYNIKKQMLTQKLYSSHAFSDDNSFFDEVDISYNYNHILIPLFELFIT